MLQLSQYLKYLDENQTEPIHKARELSNKFTIPYHIHILDF